MRAAGWLLLRGLAAYQSLTNHPQPDSKPLPANVGSVVGKANSVRTASRVVRHAQRNLRHAVREHP